MATKTPTTTDPNAMNPLLATRPEDVLGHALIKNLLARMLTEERLPQALLFAGAPLLGKRSLAIVVAKRILSGPGTAADVEGQDSMFAESDPGPETSSLDALQTDPTVDRRVSRGAHLDLSLVQPEGGSKVVKIEQVRTLQDWAWMSPSEGRAKVALVFGADTITEEAANSFLKLLEEPPPKLTLILVSDFPHRLLETVRSRCTLFAFHPIPSGEMEAWLQQRHDLDPDRARLIAGLSEGRPGLALQLLEEGSVAIRQPLLGELDVLLKNGFLSLPAVAARSLRHAGGLRPALEALLLLLRDGAVLAGEANAPETLLGVDLEEPLRTTFHGVSRSALLAAAEAVSKGLDTTRHLYIPSEALVMENVLADVGMALRRPG